jgi:hypothetical protein
MYLPTYIHMYLPFLQLKREVCRLRLEPMVRATRKTLITSSNVHWRKKFRKFISSERYFMLMTSRQYKNRHYENLHWPPDWEI